MKHTALVLLASATLALPIAAQAQSLTGNNPVAVNAEVKTACVIGQPTSVNLALGDMTGADGKISTTLASATPTVSTTIANAWCNTSNKLTLDAEPMSLVTVPSYATPAGFARLVTYDAVLSGWREPLADRPLIGDAAKEELTTDARAAASGLLLEISRLATLDAAGAAENTGAVLEAGAYGGAVVIGVTVN